MEKKEINKEKYFKKILKKKKSAPLVFYTQI